MITIPNRRIQNFNRMIESDNLLLQSKFQKDLGNLVLEDSIKLKDEYIRQLENKLKKEKENGIQDNK